MEPENAPLDVVVVGGCGHVGLPLALSLAEGGARVGIMDVDAAKIEQVRAGRMPFMETGADQLLSEMLPTGRLVFSDRIELCGRAKAVVLVIGTPIDRYMNPSLQLFHSVVDEVAPHLADDALVVLRSTVYPGTTQYVVDRLAELGVKADVVFCPERIAEGHALEEIRALPQLIGAFDDRGYQRAAEVFRPLGTELVRTLPAEAELAKLLTNTWRYMKFAIANEFFQIADSAQIDYNNVLHAIRHNYPRAADLPGPGFAAGPCLLKDTMQLAAFSSDHFPMGHAAMLINEGLPGYVVQSLDRRGSLRGRTAGILGMAFKGESDDRRTSLSYKLEKLLAFRGATVLTSDPYVDDPKLIPCEDLLDRSDLVLIGAPHRAYRDLDTRGKDVVDIWGVTGRGIRL